MSDIKKIHTANACPRTFPLIAEMQKESLLTETQLLDPTYVPPLSGPSHPNTHVNVTV